jgi:hypothetical protein
MGACCSKKEKDPFAKHGFIADSERKSRDVLCCIVFLLFCAYKKTAQLLPLPCSRRSTFLVAPRELAGAGMIAIGAVGLKYGSPMRLGKKRSSSPQVTAAAPSSRTFCHCSVRR